MTQQDYRRIVGLATRVVDGKELPHPLMATVQVINEGKMQARQVLLPDGSAHMFTEGENGAIVRTLVVPSFVESIGDIGLTA